MLCSLPDAAGSRSNADDLMKRPPRISLLMLLSWLMALSAPGQASAKGGLLVGSAVPALILPDAAGRKHSLSELKRPVTLLFFCGCAPCHDFARLWSQVQQNGDLTPQLNAHKPATVVVFLGGAAEARAFAAQTGLDPSQTLLLLDPSDQIGQRFGVIRCPRVFVADAAHRLVYTNPDADDSALHLSAPALVSRTLTAWRHLPIEKKAVAEKKTVP